MCRRQFREQKCQAPVLKKKSTLFNTQNNNKTACMADTGANPVLLSILFRYRTLFPFENTYKGEDIPGCGGMADTGDLKSPAHKACGFESHQPDQGGWSPPRFIFVFLQVYETRWHIGKICLFLSWLMEQTSDGVERHAIIFNR